MKKGIFCLEGLWFDDLRKRSTVKPILDLLELNSNIPYLHSDCATKVELEFYLEKWKSSQYNHYPILYLAFHGLENGLLINDKPYNLEALAKLLAGKCKNRVIVFASCSTINTELENLKRFMLKTGALAICGYRKVVPWISSTAFELMMLSAMQENALDGRGIAAVQKHVEQVASIFEELDFLMLTNKQVKENKLPEK